MNPNGPLPAEAELALQRQLALQDQIVACSIPDEQFIEMLNETRRDLLDHLAADKALEDALRPDFYVPIIEAQGTIEVGLPPAIAVIIAELTRRVSMLLEKNWGNKSGVSLMRPNAFPTTLQIARSFAEHLNAGKKLLQSYFARYVIAALEVRDVASEITTRELKANAAPEDEQLVNFSCPAVEIFEQIPRQVAASLRQTYDSPQARLTREMRDWRRWIYRVEVATEQDLEGVHAVYDQVRFTPWEFASLDPRISPPDQQRAIRKAIRQGGRMIKPLSRGEDDPVREGLEKGRLLITRDDDGKIMAMYNVVMEPKAVMSHMKKVLHHPDRPVRSTGKLPKFTEQVEPGGSVVSISYTDENQALKVFEMAEKGELVWSVDHAVAPDSGDRNNRYAQLGTAHKMLNYNYAAEQGKKGVLLSIFKIVGIDARKTAEKLNIPEIPSTAPIDMDASGMVFLKPIVNLGSWILNHKLGGHVVFVIEEETELEDGTRIRVQWQYLLNPLPPDEV